METDCTLLIVDDDPNIRRLMVSLAEELEIFRVLSAPSAFEALEILGREPVHVLMTDQMMPQMCGIELLALAHRQFPHTVRILVTAVADITVAVEAINRGHLFAWVQKPLSEEQFWGVLRKAHAMGMTSEAPPPAKGGTDAPAWRIGPYELERTLGEGGMGTVYRARDTRTNRVVAIKLLRDFSGDRLRLERFHREALVSEKVRHPGVVRVLDQGMHGESPYIVTEYLEGVNLGEFLPDWDGGGLPGRCRLCLALIRLVRFIHQCGVIHRDLKPGNIFIEDGPGEPAGRLRILDFGIAKIADVPQITQTGSLEGTLEFISPECLNSFSEATAASDLYSLGVVFSVVFFGVSPFRALPIAELLERKQKGSWSLPLRPDIPADIKSLIRGMMETDPSRRIRDYSRIEMVLVLYA